MSLRHKIMRTAITYVLAWMVYLLTPQVGSAQVTNVIWKANFTGVLGIQEYQSSLVPIMKVAKFKTVDFLRMVLGTAPQSKSEVLALNVIMQGGNTNLHLCIFDTSLRQEVLRITSTNANMTAMFQDGTNYVCSVYTAMPSLSSTWRGGELRIAGRGREGAGVPVNLKASVRGFMVDGRPGDIGGTFSLILKGTLVTTGAPLRVQPPMAP